jgi:ComF family protein
VSIIKELIFTPKCLSCGLLGSNLCSACSSKISPFAGKPITNVVQTYCASPYEGWVREKLIEYKNGRQRNAPALASALMTVFQISDFANPITLVPIPSAPEKIAVRGFDSISTLGAEVSRNLASSPKLTSALFLKSCVRDQVGLSAYERKKNMARAFGARCQLSGDVVLIDDVITTGATMSSAAGILRFAGAQRVFGIALCGSPKSR